MKFGIMTQLQMPRPWEPNAELTTYRNMLDQADAAERAGFQYFWLTEMHFFEEIGHSPCPDMLLAAVSQRTSRIRLGFAVILVTPSAPLLLAERVATLDVLSNGRVEFGMGRGSTPYMFEAFGVSDANSREIAAEAIASGHEDVRERTLSRLQGQAFRSSGTPRAAAPRFRRPHPPLWFAASNLSTYELRAVRASASSVSRATVSPRRATAIRSLSRTPFAAVTRASSSARSQMSRLQRLRWPAVTRTIASARTSPVRHGALVQRRQRRRALNQGALCDGWRQGGRSREIPRPRATISCSRTAWRSAAIRTRSAGRSSNGPRRVSIR